MREYKRGHSRKQQKLDRENAYDDEVKHVSEKARECFRRKPYESYTVRDCLKKWGIDVKGGVTGGQESSK